MTRGESSATILFILLTLANIGYYARNKFVIWITVIAMAVIGFSCLETP